MLKVVSELFVNVAILVSCVTFGNHLFKGRCANASSHLLRKVMMGTISGLLGCLLMIYSVQLTADIRIDFRNIPIIMMALYTSFPSAIAAAFVIGLFRVAYFGIAPSSMMAFAVSIMIGIGCGFIGKLKYDRRVKWVLSFLTVYLFSATAFVILLKNSLLVHRVLIVYFIGTAAATIIMYFFLESITKNNSDYYKMKEDADKDYLTGLNNVRRFDKLLNISIKNARERNEKLSLLFMDVDFFKKVNDTYGHLYGDIILKELGVILKKTCRDVDIISRNGGEEFSVILVDCPLEQAVEVAERIRVKVEQYDFVISPEKTIKITISIGVSSYPETTSDMEKLVEHADIALYNAKRAGRNIVSVKK